MPIVTPELPIKRYKMKLRQTEFMPDAPVRDKHIPAGSVMLVDEETALRWYERKVADLAPPDAETYSEIEEKNRRDEFYKKAQQAEGVFDRAIGQSGPTDPANGETGPRPMPRRQRGGQGHPNMPQSIGAINGVALDESDV